MEAELEWHVYNGPPASTAPAVSPQNPDPREAGGEAERRLKGRNWEVIWRNYRTKASTQKCSMYEFGLGWGWGTQTFSPQQRMPQELSTKPDVY